MEGVEVSAADEEGSRQLEADQGNTHTLSIRLLNTGDFGCSSAWVTELFSELAVSAHKPSIHPFNP